MTELVSGMQTAYSIFLRLASCSERPSPFGMVALCSLRLSALAVVQESNVQLISDVYGVPMSLFQQTLC